MKTPPLRRYTCSDYRQEMRLLGLKRRLEQDDLSDEERGSIQAEIERLEQEMGMG